MKRMTNQQIDEINELLKNHSEALTAFYNEGILRGMDIGLKWILAGVIVGLTLSIATDIVKHIKNKPKVEEEA